MADNRTLLAYFTKGGVTAEFASEIADVLQEKYGIEGDLVNLKKNPSPDLSQYKNVIIGSGVRMQKVYKEALDFIEKNILRTEE